MNTFDSRSFKRGPLAYCYDIGFTRLEAIGSDVIIVDDARSAFPPPPPDGETIQHRPPLSFTQRVLSRNVKRYSPRWPIFFLLLFRPFPPPFFLLFFPIFPFFFLEKRRESMRIITDNNDQKSAESQMWFVKHWFFFFFKSVIRVAFDFPSSWS